MKIRQRKKLWHFYFFILRMYGHDFYSFNGDDIRMIKKTEDNFYELF